MSLSEQQLLCSRPFEWFEIHPDGSAFLCCPAWLKRPIGNLLHQTIDDIWNGAVAQEIRKSILNGSFHNCSEKRCPHRLNQTDPVCHPEQISDLQIRTAIANTASHLSYRPRQLNLCFDHSCDLACPSCRAQVQIAKGEDLEQARQISQIVQSELLPQANSVTLSGFGDPFGSPTYFDLLQKLNRADFPQLQEVRLHSNGQRLTEQLWQKLPELQALVSAVEISIDAASEPTYRLNRPGGSFSRLLQNLDFLSTTGCKLTLSMVVQQNNWREIPQLLEMAARYRAKAYLSRLVNWGTFNKDEYHLRAVHLPQHPEHKSFKKLLAAIAADRQLEFGNLKPLTSAQDGLPWGSGADNRGSSS